jgi:hypothetical protein
MKEAIVPVKMSKSALHSLCTDSTNDLTLDVIIRSMSSEKKYRAELMLSSIQSDLGSSERGDSGKTNLMEPEFKNFLDASNAFIESFLRSEVNQPISSEDQKLIDQVRKFVIHHIRSRGGDHVFLRTRR